MAQRNVRRAKLIHQKNYKLVENKLAELKKNSVGADFKAKVARVYKTAAK